MVQFDSLSSIFFLAFFFFTCRIGVIERSMDCGNSFSLIREDVVVLFITVVLSRRCGNLVMARGRRRLILGNCFN